VLAVVVGVVIGSVSGFTLLATILCCKRSVAQKFVRGLAARYSQYAVSVCPSQVGVLLKQTGGSSWFSARMLVCYREIQVSTKTRRKAEIERDMMIDASL